MLRLYIRNYLPSKWVHIIKLHRGKVEVLLPNNYQLELSNVKITAQKTPKGSFDLETSVEQGVVMLADKPSFPLKSFKLNIGVTHENIRINDFLLDLENLLQLEMFGHLSLAKKAFQSKARYKTKVNLFSIAQIFDLNQTEGWVESEGLLQNTMLNWQDTFIDGTVDIKDGKLDSFLLHNSKIEYSIKGSDLRVKDAFIQTPVGHVMAKGDISLSPPYSYVLNAKVVKLGFVDLLRSFDVDQEEVFFKLDGPIELQGTFYPFFMDFKPLDELITISEFRIAALQEDFNPEFVQPPLQVKLLADITEDGMTFNHSVAASEKDRYFVNGTLFFSQPKMDLTVYANGVKTLLPTYIFELPIKGDLDAQTRIFGPYSDVQVDASIRSRNVQIEGFFLGDVGALLNYHDLKIKLTQIFGVQNNFNYELATLLFNFQGDTTLISLQGKTNQLDSHVLRRVHPALAKIPENLSLQLNSQFDLYSDDLLNLDKYKGQILAKDAQFKYQGISLTHGKATLDIKPGELRLSEFNFLSPGEGRLIGKGGMIGFDKLDLWFRINQIPFKFINDENQFVLDGKVDVQGTLSEPFVKLSSVLSNIKTRSFSFDPLDMDIRLSKKQIEVKGGFRDETMQMQGEYFFERDYFTFKMGVFRYPFYKFIKQFDLSTEEVGDISFDIDIHGKAREQVVFGMAKLDELRLIGNRSLYLDQTDIVFRGKEWQLKPFRIEGQHFFVTGKGIKDKNNTLLGNLNLKTNMSLFAEMFKGIKNAEGVVDFSAQTTGQLDEIKIGGKLAMENGKVLLMDLYPSFSNISIDASFTQDHLILNKLHAKKGPGEITVTGGIQMKNYFPQYYNFNVVMNRAFNRIVLPILNSVNFITSGKLELAGAKLPFTLQGDVILDKAVNYDELRWRSLVLDSLKRSQVGSGKKQQIIKLDLNIKADKSIRMKNNLFEGVASCRLKVKGDVTEPDLEGIIVIPRGTIFLKNHRFKIVSGTLNASKNFLETDIHVNAQAKVDKYTVFILITGKPDKIDIAFDVEPKTAPDGHVLTDNDVVTLISSGKLPERGIAEGLSIEKASEVEAWNLFAGAFQSEITDKITALSYGLIDKVEVNLHYSTFTKRVEPRGTARKQLFENLDLHISRDLRPSAAAWESNLEYRFNPNVSVQGEVNNTPLLEKGSDLIEVGGDIKFKFDFNY